MKKLERRHKVFRFDHSDPPAVELDPGESIVVETTDSFDGQFDLRQPHRPAPDAARNVSLDPGRAMPMTGPIYVRGAQPGDALAAEILGLVATSNGFVLPEFNRLLREGARPDERWVAQIVELRRGKIQLNGGLQLPYRLMVGSLGVAPVGQPVDALIPGDHGGNHDCIHCGQGATLHLPVQVPGALVSLGDVHAAMGDGEVAGTAVECDGEVTLCFHLHKGESTPGPVLETADRWMIYGYGPATDEAIAMATERTLALLMRRLGFGLAEAYTLLAAAGHMRLNEVVNPNRSARVEIPKQVVGALLGPAGREAVAQAEAVPR